MQDFHLTSQQIAALLVLHKKQRDRKKADRVKAIVLLGSGWSASEVAHAPLIDESTVRHWYDKYQQSGIDLLLTLCYQGRAPSLSERQQAELAKHLDEKTYLTSNEIRHYIHKTYGVKYSLPNVDFRCQYKRCE